MKIKKVRIGIKSVKDALEDAKEVMKKLERGERLKPVREPEIYFADFEVFRKALTPKRLELMHLIRTKKPSSINELARTAKRDVKNVADDLKYLEQIGLVETKETKRKTTPVISYDRIALEIAV